MKKITMYSVMSKDQQKKSIQRVRNWRAKQKQSGKVEIVRWVTLDELAHINNLLNNRRVIC